MAMLITEWSPSQIKSNCSRYNSSKVRSISSSHRKTLLLTTQKMHIFCGGGITARYPHDPFEIQYCIVKTLGIAGKLLLEIVFSFYTVFSYICTS